jgi:hypothetical protein
VDSGHICHDNSQLTIHKQCDGQRPTCDRCTRNGTNCQYGADDGETRFSTLKKRYMALADEVIQFRKENYQLKRRLGYTCASPEEEPCEALKQVRWRDSANLIDALPALKTENLHTEEYAATPGLPAISDDTGGGLASSLIIGVEALPWSAVANDQVVSELISQYFTFDYLYVFPPIPRSTFLNEMRLGDVDTAASCSPLLVNAICAQQCVSSRSFATACRVTQY